MFLEHKPDVTKQYRLHQTCSKNISWTPQRVIGTLFGHCSKEARSSTPCGRHSQLPPAQGTTGLLLAAPGRPRAAVH
eukprot:6278345-Pyramimonas_sp.AAC.1